MTTPNKIKLYTVKYSVYMDVEAYSDVQAVNKADMLLYDMTGADIRELIEGVNVDYQCTGIHKEE
jgi:hypothetical protein